MWQRVCRYSTSTSAAAAAEKYRRLAELVAQDAPAAAAERKVTPKSTPKRKSKSKSKSGFDVTEINAELAKLTAVPTITKVSLAEHSRNMRFIQEAKIWREWSAHDYERVAQLPEDTPEILVLGRCNVGKSSLINALLTKQTAATTQHTQYAYVKQQAGYTPCLNFYNVGKKVRLVDTPGYGVKGRAWQGALVAEYLQRRRTLVKTYVVLDAQRGATEHDRLVFAMLEQTGTTFEVVLNKADRAGSVAAVVAKAEALVADGHVTMLPGCCAAISTLTPGQKQKTHTGVRELIAGILRHAFCRDGGIEIGGGARVEHFFKKSDTTRRR